MFSKRMFNRRVLTLFQRYAQVDKSLAKYASYAFRIAAPVREKAGLIHAIGSALNVSAKHLFPFMILSEMIMVSALTIDDIVDGSVMRMGKPSLVSTTDPNVAYFVAQFMLCAAESSFVENYISLKLKYANQVTKVYENFVSANSHIQQGQYLTVRTQHNQKLITPEFMDKLAYFKAGSLFQASLGTVPCLLGKDRLLSVIEEVGKCLGVALQHRNDLCDFLWSPEDLGRDGCEDLFNGQPNLVLAYFFHNPTVGQKDRDFIVRLWKGRIRTNEHAVNVRRKVCRIIQSSGALERARQHLNWICGRAKRHISGLPDAIQKSLSKFIRILEDV